MKPTRRTRVDSTQADIVAGLRKCGYSVWIIGWPCDLLVYKHRFQTLECKPARKSGKAILRKEQQEQSDFCAFTGTPYVTTLEQALEYLR